MYSSSHELVSELRSVVCHIESVLPATRHRLTHRVLTPARQTGTRFTHPGGIEGWVDLSYYVLSWSK